MSRRARWLQIPALPAWLVVLALVLVFAVSLVPSGRAVAQDATPVSATATAAATAGTPGTPTPTRTPTVTPSPTATLTELDARLLLAQTYLQGQDYDTAAELFGAIAADTRGDPRALEGLNQALQGQAAILATQMAPFPGEVATPAPAATPVPAPTFAQATRSRLIDIGGWVLAATFVVLALYFLSALIRRGLAWLRELWHMRILPLLGRPAVPPGFLIGDFANMVGTEGQGASKIVPIAVTEKLIAWNQLVQDKQVPVEIAPEINLGAMGWIRVLWSWILPRERGYRVTGTLLSGAAGAYQLAVQRTNLARNSVDRSAIFERRDSSAESAFRVMAGEAAKWLVAPGDMEADKAVIAAARATGDPQPLPASQVFDEALNLLLPVRLQVNQGLVDFADARRRLAQAEAMVARLPSNSSLRAELSRVIAGLRKSVPVG